MAKPYKKITYQDRLEIEKMCWQKKKVIDIAKAIGVHRATIYSELKRGGALDGQVEMYDAEKAQRALFE